MNVLGYRRLDDGQIVDIPEPLNRKVKHSSMETVAGLVCKLIGGSSPHSVSC